MNGKDQWRSQLRERLLQSSELNQQTNWQLVQNLTEFLKTQSGIWAGFVAHQQEPDVSDAIKNSTHLQWVYPVIDGKNLRWVSPGPRGFAKSTFGISQPDHEESQEFVIQDLQGVLIPGLGFDKAGVRLGRGKGFYDLALSKARQLMKVGVAFDCQLVEKLPAESFDVAMDHLITESQKLKFRSK